MARQAGKRRDREGVFTMKRGLMALFLVVMLPVPALRAEVRAVTGLDLGRYLGTWHEVARYPMFFQRGCSKSKAVYGRLGEDRISVTNSCLRNGRIAVAEGDAIVKGPGKLAVSFSRVMPFRADYWVLYFDRDYRTAVVGSPGQRFGWILSRSPDRTRESLAPALAALEANGYDLSKLIWD